MKKQGNKPGPAQTKKAKDLKKGDEINMNGVKIGVTVTNSVTGNPHNIKIVGIKNNGEHWEQIMGKEDDVEITPTTL